jgi:hypothetical protein
MKVKPFVEDLLSYYIQKKYPQEFIVVIYVHNNKYNSKKVTWLINFCNKNNIDCSKAVISNYIILQFDTEEQAIDFCNSVPNSSPYCVVYSHGEIIHENT